MDLRNARLDGVDDGFRVHAGPSHDHTTNGFLRALDERRYAKGVTYVNVRNLVDVDGHAAGCAHDDALHIVNRGDQTNAADDEPGTVRLQHVAADVEIAVADGRHDDAQWQVVRAKAIRIDVDLVLLDVATDRSHFRHARHRIELVSNEPVLEGTQIAQ